MSSDHEIGQIVDGYVLIERLAAGPFSAVYLAQGIDSADRRVVKKAYLRAAPEGMATEALVWGTGRVDDAEPDPCELLRVQAAKLLGVDDAAVIRVERITYMPPDVSYRMPYVEGPTLRQAMQAGPLPATTVLNILDALTRLEARTEFLPHGDLKPENILIGPDGPIFIDPGYVGPLQTAFGLEKCLVMTLAYYPELQVDDIVAIGLVLWELATGIHPMVSTPRCPEVSTGERLTDRIRGHQRVGYHRSDWLLHLCPPNTINAAIPPAINRFLLNAVRLTLTAESSIEAAPGFHSFTELAAAFRVAVAEDGIDAFPC